MSKKILMISGPNGAGKTTMTHELISNQKIFYEFINADEIARGLAPLHPESMALTASKLMLKRMKELLDSHRSFAFETTASGTNYIKHLKAAKAKGYDIDLTFLWLSSPEQAVKRVIQRVKQGGHHIPKEVILRRYYTGLKNLLAHYLPLVDSAILIDNSVEESKKVIAIKDLSGSFKIMDKAIWKQIEEVAYEG